MAVLLFCAPPSWAASPGTSPYSRRAAASAATLSHLGPDGVAAAKFAAQTAPRVAHGFRAIDRSGESASALSGVGKALSGSGGGMGFPLPVLLIGMLAGAIVLAAWRLRRGEGVG